MAREVVAKAEWGRELRAMIALAVPVVLSELGWMAQGVVEKSVPWRTLGASDDEVKVLAGLEDEAAA